ncbi:MAG: hypothetical protein KJP27_02665 [Altererythrobacter sp.]|nr:hypothetical protein [Altererythrobacter sp.]
MTLRKLAIALAATAALSSVPAQAERLAVDGVYAARTDGARGVTEISIEPIRGREGIALENALADQFGSARIYGEQHFRIVPSSFDNEGSDPGYAQLRGFARSRVYDVSDGEIERTRCVRKIKHEDGEKECVESVTDVYECRRLHVEFRPDVALFAGEDALYQRQDNFSNSERYCADSSYIPSAEAMIEPMISRFARAVRLDLAPEQRFDRIRILESRSGLERGDRQAFKNAIKLTKSDPVGACIAFEDILTRNPYQRSALYNAALCREADGQLDLAAEAYGQLILASDKSRFRNGMARVDSRFLAREQLAFLGPHAVALASASPQDASSE